VAAAGVAAVATPKVVGSGKDQIRTFIVEVFRMELVVGCVRFFFWSEVRVGFDWLRHNGG